MRSRSPILMPHYSGDLRPVHSCKEKTATAPPPEARPIGTPIQIAAPLGLPPVRIPADNPPTAKQWRWAAGCITTPLSPWITPVMPSCHSPQTGFCDGRPGFLRGAWAEGRAQCPHRFQCRLLHHPILGWPRRQSEQQAGGPMANPIEMGHTLAGVEQKLNADASYRADFKKAFGSDVITIEMAENPLPHLNARL